MKRRWVRELMTALIILGEDTKTGILIKTTPRSVPAGYKRAKQKRGEQENGAKQKHHRSERPEP